MFKGEREKFAFLSLKLSRMCVFVRLICFTHTHTKKNKLDLNFLRRTNIRTDTFSIAPAPAAVNVMVHMIRPTKSTLFAIISFAVGIIVSSPSPSS